MFSMQWYSKRNFDIPTVTKLFGIGTGTVLVVNWWILLTMMRQGDKILSGKAEYPTRATVRKTQLSANPEVLVAFSALPHEPANRPIFLV
jgi:hypothetical protein